ncbi:MAG: hypothetical protein KA035_02835 [Candidatus Levybacteria bacterium]|nr:hypothetical protein [Candidatus Levybacteria bacterium]
MVDSEQRQIVRRPNANRSARIIHRHGDGGGIDHTNRTYLRTDQEISTDEREMLKSIGASLADQRLESGEPDVAAVAGTLSNYDSQRRGLVRSGFVDSVVEHELPRPVSNEITPETKNWKLEALRRSAVLNRQITSALHELENK